jgi:uncharacterized membrane protein
MYIDQKNIKNNVNREWRMTLMKLIFANFLLAFLLFSIIYSLDFFSGMALQGLVAKSINPFRVMEPAEYVIIILFCLFFVIQLVGAYLNKKKKNNPSQN